MNDSWFYDETKPFVHVKEGKIYVIVETDGKCEEGKFEFEIEE